MPAALAVSTAAAAQARVVETRARVAVQPISDQRLHLATALQLPPAEVAPGDTPVVPVALVAGSLE